MGEEVPKSTYTPVSDENTYASSGLNKDDSISADDKSAERIENVRKIDAESSSKDINFDSQRQCNFDSLPVAIAKNIDASGNDPKWMSTPMQEGEKSGIEVIVSADSPVIGSRHGQCSFHKENEASELNVASPMFTSFEMKKFFRDDNIDGILKSDTEMSNVNSMIEDGKESHVGTPQVAAGKHSYHEHQVEEVEELKSDFPSCGDGKGDEFQELVAVLMRQ